MPRHPTYSNNSRARAQMDCACIRCGGGSVDTFLLPVKSLFLISVEHGSV